MTVANTLALALNPFLHAARLPHKAESGSEHPLPPRPLHANLLLKKCRLMSPVPMRRWEWFRRRLGGGQLGANPGSQQWNYSKSLLPACQSPGSLESPPRSKKKTNKTNKQPPPKKDTAGWDLCTYNGSGVSSDAWQWCWSGAWGASSLLACRPSALDPSTSQSLQQKHGGHQQPLCKKGSFRIRESSSVWSSEPPARLLVGRHRFPSSSLSRVTKNENLAYGKMSTASIEFFSLFVFSLSAFTKIIYIKISSKTRRIFFCLFSFFATWKKMEPKHRNTEHTYTHIHTH